MCLFFDLGKGFIFHLNFLLGEISKADLSTQTALRFYFKNIKHRPYIIGQL